MTSLSSPSLLAAAIAVHTVEEAAMLPSYQWALGLTPVNTIFETFLDSLPIFIVLPLASEFLAKRWSNGIRLVLATVCLVHPLSDHAYFTLKMNRLRPGSVTALLLLLPLGIWNIFHQPLRADTRRTCISNLTLSDLGGIALGGLISYFLYSEVAREFRALGVY